jgi:hypothetical protein
MKNRPFLYLFPGLLAFCLLISSFFSGCSAAFNETYTPSTLTALPEIRYMKDKKGLCYAYTLSMSAYSFATPSISYVPCKEVGL